MYIGLRTSEKNFHFVIYEKIYHIYTSSTHFEATLVGLKFRFFSQFLQHTGRLRGKISDTLLGDLEPDEATESRLPPKV